LIVAVKKGIGAHVARPDDAKSPGSGGASPYLPPIVLVIVIVLVFASYEQANANTADRGQEILKSNALSSGNV
jgi:hypothetical protein